VALPRKVWFAIFPTRRLGSISPVRFAAVSRTFLGHAWANSKFTSQDQRQNRQQGCGIKRVNFAGIFTKGENNDEDDSRDVRR
jgi:hypothetical protein